MLKKRYRQIVWFFARIVSSLALWEIILPHVGLRRWAARGREARLQSVARQFRHMAINMGGVLIKVGQFLSTRMDVLPPVITDELAGLQDEVPPEEFSALRQVAESELGAPLEEKYVSFNPQPLAAASLGQAHEAQVWLEEAADAPRRLLDVVVKIQRPGIEKLIATDLAALRTVGKWLHRYPPIRRRVDIPALLNEFTRILYEEIDYIAEGKNAETFAENFKEVECVLVPRVIWSHTTRRTLTLQNVTGIKITDYAAITAAGMDLEEVAERLLDTYFKQIFEDGFFHADPHPGNLFVRLLRPEDSGNSAWLLTFVDFGMVGHISPNTRQALRELVMGVGTRDIERIVRAYQLLGILLPSADVKLLEKATERMFERYWGKNMAELRDVSPAEIAKLVQEFSELLYEMPFQVPHDLIFLGRCVGILSGMCTGLNPEFNVWKHLSPYAQKMVAQEGVSGLRFWLQELGTIAEKLFSLPQRTEAVLSRVERGELKIQDVQLAEQVRGVERAIVWAGAAVLAAGLFIGGVLLYIDGSQMLAQGTWAAAALALIWAALGLRKK